jgi:hypothetical protein
MVGSGWTEPDRVIWKCEGKYESAMHTGLRVPFLEESATVHVTYLFSSYIDEHWSFHSLNSERDNNCESMIVHLRSP